ncbi:MAG: GNAT family N-acetyltransferase [Clostridia bacterium]|nr:GNAT family N-acetyltransferase [Clostridia bacterium]
MLEQGDIIIRCIEETDLEFVSFCASPTVYGAYQPFRFSSPAVLIGDYQSGAMWNADGGILLIEELGEAVGLAEVTLVREGLARVGMILLPDNRGCGIGTQALGMLRDYLADNYPVARIEADTDVENIAGQRILENNGFVCEGTMRCCRFYRGRYHDSYLYSYITELGR